MRGAIPIGVQGDPQRVRTGRAGAAATPSSISPAPGVRRDDVPAPIDGQARIRLVGLEHLLEAVAHRAPCRGRPASAPHRPVRGPRRSGVGSARAAARRSASASRNTMAATRSGPPGLDEAHVTRGHVGLDGEVELAEPAPLPPLLHQRAERAGAALKRRSPTQCGPANLQPTTTHEVIASLTRTAELGRCPGRPAEPRRRRCDPVSG